jgi:1-deoxy-D-xylulose-5-phosphate synthase
MKMALLDGINSPSDIKGLDKKQLKELASEIRCFLIDKVSKTGGHLASNLGVVELTLALHYVYEMPQDKIIWDVGHQTYVHKILTGRKDRFGSLRKFNGLSGFPKPCESPYDLFVTGHSSTSVSAALGMAKARDLSEDKYNVVAVIGDGALTGGMALEALNHAGASNTNITVVLNDNEMSIGRNVGGISKYLNRIRTAPAYLHFKYDIKNVLKKMPVAGNTLFRIAERIKDSFKYLLVQGMLFEDMGFTYLGPVDGHDIGKLMDIFKRCKTISGPVLVHVVTKKGKGYSYAEEKPDLFHGIGPFDIETGKMLSQSGTTYSKVLGSELTKLAEDNSRIVAITAAMASGTGLSSFAKKYPKRFVDVGIAEQHAVTFAAGLAASGYKPFFTVYSTFLQRAYDQVIHDICIQNLPVCLCVDRAGIVGEDGETHQGICDLSYLRTMPNMTVMAPKNIDEFKIMLDWCSESDFPTAIRYPRGGDMDVNLGPAKAITLGGWEQLIEGKDVAILACGRMVQFSYIACQRLNEKGIYPKLINCRFIKPYDRAMLSSIINEYSLIITVEDNFAAGGFGSSILEHVAGSGYGGKIINLGFPDEFIPQGSPDQLYKEYGLDSEGICNAVVKHLQ